MSRIDRRAGRAYRRARKAGHPAPALAAASHRLTDSLVNPGWALLLQIFSASPPRSRPLIHNGRKYHR